MEAALRCRCGKVRGRVVDASPRAVNRIVCYCDDCQAFAHHLGRADLLDAHGGSDIVQVAPGALRFDHGGESIVALRLSPKGLFRFYAPCCHTPMGNAVGPSVPFVGVIAHAFEDPDGAFGKPTGAILGRYAVGEAPKGSTKLNPALLARAIAKVIGWKIRGKAWPNPYFERGAKTPNRPTTTLTKAEREALRPSCGPNALPT